jgi:DNA-binding NarL/FixJ family response regulator
LEPNLHFGEAVKNFLNENLICKTIELFSTSEVLHDGIPIPDILIIDTSVLQRDEITSLRVFDYLHPDVVSIAISMHNGIPSLSDLIRLGFKGFISKRNVYTHLIPVIQSALNGEYNFKDHSNN